MQRVIAAIAFCSATVSVAMAGQAYVETRGWVDIQTQPLESALQRLARERGIRAVFISEDISGHNSRSLRGAYTLDEALVLILSGTGLDYRYLDAYTVVIAPSEEAHSSRPVPAGTTGFKPIQLAQADTVRERTDSPPEVLEEVTVTGTNIRGVAPIGSSLTAVGRQELVESGADTVFAAMQQVPALSLLGMNESSRGSQGGSDNYFFQSSLNLRSLGPQATLTLLDGNRMPTSERGGFNVDPSFLPSLALERAEVLADGASAIYGSDAVAGVVNFILRRNLDGLEISGRGGFADGYSERSLEIAAGKIWDSGQFMLALASNYHTNLAGSDRVYNTSDLRPFGGTDFRTTSCTPGTISIGGSTYAVPNGNPAPDSLVAGTRNLCSNGSGTDLLPEQRRDAAVVTFTQDLSDRITLVGDGYVARRTFEGHYEHSAVSLTIPDDHAFFVLPAGTALASLPDCTDAALAGHKCYAVSYDLTDAYGLRRASGHVDYYHLRSGLNIDLGRDWQLQLGGNYGLSEITERSNSFNSSVITAGTTGAGRLAPSTAFDPFGNRTDAAVVSSLFDWVFNSTGSNRLLGFSASVNGALFDMPGGPMKSAIGIERRNEQSATSSVLAQAGSPPTFSSKFDRDVTAAYGEIVVPLVGSDNAMPGVRSLELAMAGRFEDYSDFGNTSNPKLGLNWSPLASLTLRGSYSKSFRAPAAKDLAGLNTPSLSYSPVSDPQAGGAQRYVLWIDAPNPEVKPERADAYSLGFDFTPAALPGLQLSATWFNIDYVDKIERVYLNTSVLVDERLYQDLITRTLDPADYRALEASLLASGYIQRGQSFATTAVAIIDGTPHNLGAAHTNGLDFSLRYPLLTDARGNFDFFLSGTKLHKYDVKTAANAPEVSKLDIYGYPVSLRMRGGVAWQIAGFNASAFVNYTGSYDYPSGSSLQRVDSSQTVDAVVGYGFTQAGWLNGLKLSLNVANVFDEDPPFVNLGSSQYNAGGFDAQISSPVGREFALTVGKKW